MLLEDPSNDVLVDLYPEGMCYLLGYLQAVELWILSFHRHDGSDTASVPLSPHAGQSALSVPFRYHSSRGVV